MSQKKAIKERVRAQKKRAEARYYKLNSILGNDWAIFFAITGGRMIGKSYSVADFLCNRKKKLRNKSKCYWLRISETSTKALLANKADKLVDPDLKRTYDLNLTTKGFEVYNKNEPFMTVLPLSSFGKMKGVGFFDKDYDGEYNIVLDEFQLEQNEKRTSFDILYNFIGVCENLIRNTKSKVRVFLLGNTLEEASTILKAFNFIPEKFGRFYLKSKRCVIDNLEPTDEYIRDRKGSVADILGGSSMSNYTNELNKDRSLLFKGHLKKPTHVIRFWKNSTEWFTIWDDNIIKKYNNEQIPESRHICMRPYIGAVFNREKRINIFERYDARSFKFTNLIDQTAFQAQLELLRKQ